MQLKKRIVIILSLSLILTACKGTDANLSQTQVGSQSVFKNNSQVEAEFFEHFKADKTANWSLGLEVLKQLDQQENVLISPVSLSIALAMLQNGASGVTQEEMLNILHRSDSAMVNQYYNTLSSIFEEVESLEVGNSLWIKEGIEPKIDFVDQLKANFDAEVHVANFNDVATLEAINQWIERETKGMLKDTLDEIDARDIAFLINTIYLKGEWEYPFEANATKESLFTLFDGRQIDVEMMHMRENLNYAETEWAQIAEFPYTNGLTMRVILPKTDVESALAAFDLNLVPYKLEDLNVSMPKFEYEVKNALTEVLKEMGMVQAFDPYGAEFQPMIDLRDENVYIGNIFQHTKIINDEKGTEAAAATVVEIEATSAEFEEQPIDFHMNKPFIYVIEENVSGIPMFMGIVYKP